MNRWLATLVVIGLLSPMLNGCAGPGRRAQASPPGSPAARGWDYLGNRTVQGRNDVDEIVVTGAEGAFRKLKFEVTGSALEIYNVVVTFRNGETVSPNTRLRFAQGAESRTLDLPGNNRIIRKVRFRYGNLPGGGRATVNLYGR